MQESRHDELSADGEPTSWVRIAALLPAHSPRAAREDSGHSRMLAEVRSKLPPILVHRATMRVIDGTHRVSATRIRGEDTIEVRWFHGDDREAFRAAVRANVTHGLPLSRAERLAAAARLIAEDPRCSDRSIAVTAGLSAATVGSLRRRLPTAATGAEARVGRDGRVRPLDPAAGRERAKEILLRSPDASLRRIAREAGISPATARDVRRRLKLTTTADSVDPQATAQQPPRHLRPIPALEAGPTLDGLSKDPALRHSDSGRAVLRWLSSRLLRQREGQNLTHQVPPHAAYLIAQLADQCAEEWGQLAMALREKAQRAS
jgi:ParB-like chromosome segregation protein Spo0J